MKQLLIWVLLIIAFLAIWQFLSPERPPVTQVTFSEFMAQVHADQEREPYVESVSVKGREFTFWVTDPKHHTKTKRMAIGPSGDLAIIAKELYDAKVAVSFEEEDPSSIEHVWVPVALMTAPMVMMAFLFSGFVRQLKTKKGAKSVGSSTAGDARDAVTFADVAGIDEAVDELRDRVVFLRSAEKIRQMGGRAPPPALITGALGTGKTHLARAVAGEAKVPFISMSGSDMELAVGLGVARVRDLFEQGRRNAPCVVFIDEIDALVTRSEAVQDSERREAAQALAELFAQIDAFATTSAVILGATSRPEVLGPAFLRAGRFEHRIDLRPPDARARREILRLKTERLELTRDVDLDLIAERAAGLMGRDIEVLVNIVTILAAGREGAPPTMADFEEAMRRVLKQAAASKQAATRQREGNGQEENRSDDPHDA